MTWTGPSLDDLFKAADPDITAALGDDVEYMAPGGAFVPLRAMVDYGEGVRDLATGSIIAQDITVRLQKTDVVTRPASTARLKFGDRTGTFRPINVLENLTEWVCTVEKVSA